MSIIYIPRIKLSYIQSECEHRKLMFLLYKLYYTRILSLQKNYVDSLVEQQRKNFNSTGNRSEATQAPKRNLYRISLSHLCLLSNITARVGRLDCYSVSIKKIMACKLIIRKI
jgi:hypothetical protein